MMSIAVAHPDLGASVVGLPWAPELVPISGYSGIGKSALVQELHRLIAHRHGLFIAGKFELYKRDIPYATVIQAFRERMLDILAETAPSIATWRQRITAALGHNGQLECE